MRIGSVVFDWRALAATKKRNKTMERVTVMPWFVALFAGLLALPPTNIYKICAWNSGTMRLDPWRVRSTAAVQKVTQTIRAWCAGLWSPRLGVACLALLLAVLVAHVSAIHGSVLLAVIVPVATLRANRAQLLREAEALQGTDGSFRSDADRSAFDSRIADIEALDVQIRQAPSESIAERDPLDPGAPTGGTRSPAMRLAAEPTDADLATTAERTRVTGIQVACRAARMTTEFQDQLVRDGIALVDAQARVFEEMRKRGGDAAGPRINASPDVQLGADPLVHVRAGIENALTHRLAGDLRNAKGELYSDVSAIPYNRVGLLLGTAKYTKRRGFDNPYYTNRIKAATALLKAGKIKYLIVSGDNGREEYNEPEMMREDLIKAGIDSTRLYLDYAGFRTFDSVVRLKEVFGQDSVTVISQRFHNERALYIASKEDIVANGFNAKGKPGGEGFYLREKLARVKVFVDYLIGTNPKFLGKKVELPD